jgi:cytochrome P450
MNELSKIQELVRERSSSVLGLDPFVWYKQMRESDPIHFEPQGDLWELFKYDDVQKVLSNPAVFSSERGRDDTMTSGNILMLDPPRHDILRALVSQVFTPRTTFQMSERISAIVNDLLDKNVKDGHLDVIKDLAYPLPVMVITEMLGIPSAEQGDFKRWSNAIVGTSHKESAEASKVLTSYFQTVLVQRRWKPGKDLVSSLLAAEIDGVPLLDSEVIDFCILLLIAGNETTTNLIGNAIWCFDEFSDTIPQLHAEPALLPGAIEEVLRFRSPVQRTTRSAVVDTEINGTPIKAGQTIFCWIASANRDETHFSQGEIFDIRRSSQRHQAFGYGIHFCLGAPLARLETKIALGCMLERFRTIQRVRETPLQAIASFFGYGVEHLPVTLTAH